MTVFLIVGGVGFALLLASLLLDGVLDSVLPSVELPGAEVVSGPVIGAFAAAFGETGAIVSSATGAGPLTASLAGVAAGAALGGVVALITRSLQQSGTDAAPRSSDLIGLAGTVVSDIPAEGLGTVSVRLAGAPHKLSARAARPLPAGTSVEVTAVLSSTAVRVSARD